MRNSSESIDYLDIGNRIKALRKRKKLNQEELAELVNMSASHISHIENATTKISLPCLVDIANSLDVSVDYLLCGSLNSTNDIYVSEMTTSLSECTPDENRIIYETVMALISSLEKYGKSWNMKGMY